MNTPVIPLSADELAALIARNEARKQRKAHAPAFSVYYPAGGAHAKTITFRSAEKAQAAYDFVCYAQNDRPEDDIDRLLALVAALQAARLNQTGTHL